MKEIKTKEEFNEAIKGKVLVDFYADWCGPCKMLTPVLEEVESNFEDLTFIRVNTDNLMSIARDYKIMSIPNLKIIENGKIISEKVGFMSRTELLEFLEGGK